jgi:hypothetical protein
MFFIPETGESAVVRLTDPQTGLRQNHDQRRVTGRASALAGPAP